MSADTPIARVARYVEAAQRHTPEQWIDKTTVTSGTRYRPAVTAELTLPDLAALLERLAEVCPDHERCTACGAHLCTSCGIGEPSICDSDPHCADAPWCWCRECTDDAARERYYEQQADLTGGRF